MKNFKYIILLFVSQFIFAGCTEILEIDTSSVKPKIVLNGIIEPDSVIKIKVSKSFSLQYTDTFEYDQPLTEALIKNAELTLFVNDEKIGKMTEIKIDSNSYRTGTIFQSDYRPKSGDKIKIEASVPGFKSVWAETQIPEPIIINKIDTATYIFKNDYYIDGYYDYEENSYSSVASDFKIPMDAKSMNLKLKMNINGSDNTNENYYAMTVYQKIKDTYSTWEYQPHLDLTAEPLFNNNAKNAIYAFFSEEGHSEYNAKIFTDNLFNNGKYTINMSLWGYYFYRITSYYYDGTVDVEMYNKPIEITIHTLSKELYNYILSNTSSAYDEIPYIFENDVTYTNVHNGIGIVGSRAIATKTIEIPPYTGKIDAKSN